MSFELLSLLLSLFLLLFLLLLLLLLLFSFLLIVVSCCSSLFFQTMLDLPYRFENCEVIKIKRNVTKGTWIMDGMERLYHPMSARS